MLAPMVGPGPGHDRAGLPGFLAAALRRRRHPRAGHVRAALSAVGRVRDVRERGDGVRSRADLAGTAPSPPGCIATSGGVYVFTAIPAAVCAMVIGAATPFGPILAVSNVLLASLWLWFTLNGYLAGRDRRFVPHRRHMVLSATLALSIITNRIWAPILFIALHPLQDSAVSRRRGAVPVGGGGRRRLAGLDDADVSRSPVADAYSANTAVDSFSAVRHAIGVTSGRLGTTRRRTYLDGAGHGDRIRRQDRAGYPRFRAGLGPVRRADRTEGRAEHPLSRVG